MSSVVQGIFAEMGFDRWAYQTQSEDLTSDPEPILVHNFPEDWESYYVSNNCSQIDPVITLGSNAKAPFRWSSLIKTADLTAVQKEFYANAADAGLPDGLAVPIPSPLGHVSMVSMASLEKTKGLTRALEENVDQLVAISCAFHSMATDLIRRRMYTDREETSLTPRQKETLLWVARGKTSWEVSQILGISERTVISHVESAKERLGASNRYDVVVKAIIYGHIAP